MEKKARLDHIPRFTKSFSVSYTTEGSKHARKVYRHSSNESDDSGLWPKAQLTRVYDGAATFAALADPAWSEKNSQHRYYVSTAEQCAPGSLNLPSLSFSFVAYDPDYSPTPQHTLEQPSMLTFWGEKTGTITLNHWLQLSSTLQSKEWPIDSLIVHRDIERSELFERLIFAQDFVETDDFSRHCFLYDKLIMRWDQPEVVDITQEVRDLANCLAGHDFWDLSLLRYQALGEYVSGRLSSNVTCRFYYQMLLGFEVYHRLQSLDVRTRNQLLKEMPPKVAWSLAAAKLWLENVRIHVTPENYLGLYFVNEPGQISLLKEFAQKTKWPTAADACWTLDHLGHRRDVYADQHFLSWISGVVLPGPSTSWLLMNALLCLDAQVTHILDDLDSKYQNTGFQYNHFTYWYRECITGKVLAAARGATEVAGWICACPPSRDLATYQLVHVVQKEVQHKMHSKDVKQMSHRTDPLGPSPIEKCRPSDYALPVIGKAANTAARGVGPVHIQEIKFIPAEHDDASLFYSAVIFSIENQEPARLSLRYNVSFISAVHCTKGPHLLSKAYKYETKKITELPDLSVWGHAWADEPYEYKPVDGVSAYDANASYSSSAPGVPFSVLVIEAFGSSGAEVMARAWCSNLGLSAVVADLGTTCAACAIREAYAACVSVVILTRGDEGVGKSECKGECYWCGDGGDGNGLYVPGSF